VDHEGKSRESAPPEPYASSVPKKPTFVPTERTQVRRRKERATYDVDTVHAILDEGFVCHLGFAVDGRPWVFPTTYARVDDQLYVHGAAGNFGLRALAAGAEVCVTITLVDGIVLAKSGFHSSINYRSVMLFGRGELLTDLDEKRAAMDALVDHIVPGRAADCRAPTDDELRQTTIVRIPISEASAKVRVGGPRNDEADLALPYWSGELPLATVPGEPIASADGPNSDAPAYVTRWERPASRSRRAGAGTR